MRYTLTDGSTMTPEELVELVEGMSLRNAKTRLGRTRHRERLLKPIRITNNGKPPKKYTLSNGDVYTIVEIMEITGCKYATVVSRLYHNKKRDVGHILKTSKLTEEDADKAWGNKVALERMLGDPDGFWQIFNKMGTKSA